MLQNKKEHPAKKSKLHPRNKHRERYNFKKLTASCPELSEFVKLNDYKDESINFFNPKAVKMLNTALLKYFYNIENWDIPNGYLCPPIPGRADYIHYIADLLANSNNGKNPKGNKIKCLDIGVGASCIYPIIGNTEYGWSFIGTDIDPIAIDSANTIINSNPILKGKIETRLQNNHKNIFNGIFKEDERIDLSICNPPFHSSLAEAESGTIRKLSNLKGETINKAVKNFGGKNNELWCFGGEEKFIRNMIHESKQFANSCLWFSSLVSKKSTLKSVYSRLKKMRATEIKTISMGQGNKISRIVAWTFLTKEQQINWMDKMQ